MELIFKEMVNIWLNYIGQFLKIGKKKGVLVTLQKKFFFMGRRTLVSVASFL